MTYRKERWGITSTNYPAAGGQFKLLTPKVLPCVAWYIRTIPSQLPQIGSAGSAWNGL